MQLPPVEEVIANIKKQFKGTKWGNQLEDMLCSQEMKCIVEQLQEIKKCNMSFLPLMRDTFTWAHKCPFETIKVVVLVDMPVTIMQGKEGIPMSSNRNKPGYIVSRLRESLGYSRWNKVSCNLARWCRQGILLMPVSGTTTYTTRDQHYNIWSNFTSHVICKINESYPDVPWIMVNKEAVKYRNQVKSKHVYEMYLTPRIRGEQCWGEVNKLLVERGEEEIRW